MTSLSLSFEVMALKQSINKIKLNISERASEIDIEIIIHLNDNRGLVQSFKGSNYKNFTLLNHPLSLYSSGIGSIYQRCGSLISEPKIGFPSLVISSWNCSMDDILEEVKCILCLESSKLIRCCCKSANTFSSLNGKKRICGDHKGQYPVEQLVKSVET